MRKIEFRGKSVKTNEWVYGYLIEGEADGKLYIGKNNMQLTEVDPETVGLFIVALTTSIIKLFTRAILSFIKKDVILTSYLRKVVSCLWAAMVRITTPINFCLKLLKLLIISSTAI